jgi:hypothetical protein
MIAGRIQFDANWSIIKQTLHEARYNFYNTYNSDDIRVCEPLGGEN